MALNIWTQPSGYNLGTFPESVSLTQPLPVANDTGVSYAVISGNLPGGLFIVRDPITNIAEIKGAPYEVVRDTTFTFVVRASLNGQISDRTLSMVIQNNDYPSWITPSGNLQVGPVSQYFVQDKTYVNFPLQIFDGNVAAGAKLVYSIGKDGGQLPPGLSLTPDGHIIGFVLPALSITPQSGDGTFDNSYYDIVAYDFSLVSDNGYDTYQFDNVNYDFNLSQSPPKHLNRTYQFVVTVDDGNFSANRTFSIFVVADDFFTANNTVIRDSTSLFTADISSIRAPVWSTDTNLGTHRADNYITIPLETYDREHVLYSLELVNARITATTQQIALTDNIFNGTSLTIFQPSAVPIAGQKFTFTNRLNGVTSLIYTITNVASIGNNYYRLTIDHALEVNIPNWTSFLIGDLPSLPTGMIYDVNYSELAGRVSYQPAITKNYSFTVTATRIGSGTERAYSSKLFTLTIIGNIDSVITWNTPNNLGTINANFISNLAVSATTTVPNAVLVYTLQSGKLPPGLVLSADGEITGKANQFADSSIGTLGITTFDLGYNKTHNILTPTTFDQATTTFDRVYTFTILAQDQFGYSAVARTFKLDVLTPSSLTYSNIRVQPYLKIDQRTQFLNFIKNTDVFTPTSIYRPNDPNFGIQTNLNMLVYAGIQTEAAGAYVGAMGLNHKRKQFFFGDLKKAIAQVPGTTTAVYEVIYAQMYDPLEPNGQRLKNFVKNIGRENEIITADNSEAYFAQLGGAIGPNDPPVSVDSTGYQVSDPTAGTYYVNSISNWRDRLKQTIDHFITVDGQQVPVFAQQERNYLPLWMRSIQPGTYSELGFVLAVPIVFCKPGTADTILLNIKNLTSFDFKQLNYTVDRYIIDSVQGRSGDKYLVFKNDRITV